jgi:hypothetical protein
MQRRGDVWHSIDSKADDGQDAGRDAGTRDEAPRHWGVLHFHRRQPQAGPLASILVKLTEKCGFLGGGSCFIGTKFNASSMQAHSSHRHALHSILALHLGVFGVSLISPAAIDSLRHSLLPRRKGTIDAPSIRSNTSFRSCPELKTTGRMGCGVRCKPSDHEREWLARGSLSSRGINVHCVPLGNLSRD